MVPRPSERPGATHRSPGITYATNQRTALTVDAPGVLADVDDTPDDTHTASLASEPDNGAIDVDPDGSFTYTPNVGFAGTDTFTFRVADAFGNTDEGVATITVRPRLTLTRTGQGIVTIEPGDIVCDASCETVDVHADVGATVTLLATPEPGHVLQGWSGDACDGSNELTCQVTLSAEARVTANFIGVTSVLEVFRDGDGTGNITSDPGTINLNAGQTSDEFDHGTQITLTATPDDGNTFDGWSAGPCDGELDTTCTFTIDSTTVVTATFSPEVRTLSVTTSGTGNGNVTSEPSGIDVNRGTDSATFDDGTEITLTATPTGSSVFTEWTSGPCAGSIETTCTFTLTEDTAVTATFTRRRLLLGDAGHANDRVASATAALPRTRS